jgi:protein pelota
MRLVHKDLKHGKIKLLVETLDDLWHLRHLIEQNDIVTAQSWRREQKIEGKIRPERPEKRRLTLSIKVESIGFHQHANRLRLLGTIVEGPGTGKHHSFGLEVGAVLTIEKEWKRDHLDRIREAVSASRRPRVLLVALDDFSAEIALVRQYGLEVLGGISHPRTGKLYPSEWEADEKRFFHRVATAMGEIVSREGVQAVIVAGPGFTKNSFLQFLREKFPDLAQKVRAGDVSSGGAAGLYEIVRRGLVEMVSREDRISRETSLIERLMAEIARSGLAAYGKSEVEKALRTGAIDKLLVADELLRRDRATVDEVLEQARRTRGEVIIVSTEHDAGKQLLSLGGLAALLRFRTS